MANQSRRNGKWRSKARRNVNAFGRSVSYHPLLEGLEARRLLAVVINEFGGPNTVTEPTGITLGPDGNLWFTESNPEEPAIGRITPSGAIENFSYGLAGNSLPIGIAAGSDGALWFTDAGDNMIGRITTAGTITEYPVPTANAGLDQITAGPDGNLWFTESNSDKIGRITTAGVVTEFTIPTANSRPIGITAGADGDLWFTEYAGNKIGQITTSGQITEYSTGITANSGPDGITLGPDGNLWFTEATASQIGQITEQGVVTEFSSGISANSFPSYITAGPDGRLWFTENQKVGAITTDGTVTEYSDSAFNGDASLGAITSGPDGNLWFTEGEGDHVDRITTSGAITQFPPAVTLPQEAGPLSITPGPQETLWFTEQDANQIGETDTAGDITQYSAGITSGAGPESITEGPSNLGTPNLYFTEAGANQIGEITTGGTVTEFPISVLDGSPDGITLGPDNNLWFTENVSNYGTNGDPSPQIISFSPTGTLVDDYTLPVQYAGDFLSQIATGPDGALWFTVDFTAGGGAIGRVTTGGQFSFYTIPNGTTSNSYPVGIVAGFNNDLWFADEGNSAIGQITTAGVIMEYNQGLSVADVPYGITAGPDGNYWFTDPSDVDDPIGRITPQGVITLYQTPTSPAGPMGIALGPDDNIWFTEAEASQIGQAVLTQSIFAPTGKPASVVATIPSSFEIATFEENSSATNPTNFSATINYGDGTSGPGTIMLVPGEALPGTTGSVTYEVVGTHAYATVGAFAAEVTISTGTGSLAPVPVTIDALNPLQVTGQDVDGTAGLRTNTLVAIFTDLDTTAMPDDFTAIVNWADGTSSAGNIYWYTSPSGLSEFAVYAGHIYATAGAFVASVTVEDTRYGLTASGSSTATVAAATAFSPYNEIGPNSLTPGAGATDITLGPDNALWFTESNSSEIGRIDSSGDVTEFSNGISAHSDPTGITLGPDGNLWFTESEANQIGRITTAGVVTEFSDGITSGADPNSITSADGELWFTEPGLSQIGMITQLGVVTEFSLGLPEGYDPDSITSDSQGNLWFVGGGSDMVGRITPTGLITLYAGATGSGFLSITMGPDGNLWFTESNSSEIGRINPTTFQVSEFATPNVEPTDITAGPDNKLYFTASGSTPQVDQITTSGFITPFTTGLTLGSNPGGIATGPDNNIYFTEAAGDRIGQVVLPQSSIPLFYSQPGDVYAGSPFTFTIATFTESSTIPTTANFDALINWGDGTVSTSDVVGSDGQFSVTGSHTYEYAVTYNVTVTIFNAAGSISTPLTLSAQPAITVTGLPINEPADRTFTVPVADFTDYGAPRPPGSYDLYIEWGDGTSSLGTLGMSAVGQLEIIGTHDYAVPGNYVVNTAVQVIADTSAVGFGTSTATVTAPVLSAAVPTIQAVAGTLFSGIVAYVTDSSQNGVIRSTYDAAISWGDGTPATIGTIVDISSSAFEVVGSHVYATPGSFPVNVLVEKTASLDQAAASGIAQVSAPVSPFSFVVTNTNDSGPGSLRQAIIDVDESTAPQTITFAIPAVGVATIGVTSPLPTILFPTIIDGPSQATFEGVASSHPLVEINGEYAGAGPVAGLTFAAYAGGSQVVSVSVYGFSGAQVEIVAPNVILIGNYLGLTAAGIMPQEPGVTPTPSFANSGVEVFDPGAIIGGLYPGQRNVISGNDGWGILVDGPPASIEQIVGNLVGLDPSGNFAEPNLLDGVAFINGAGHEFLGPANVISGNSGNGVLALASSGDLIYGNAIGTNSQGTSAVTNGDYGIDVDQGSNAILIGGLGPLSPNVISGNHVVGVGVLDGSSGIVLQSNQIGTDVSGEQAIGNGIAGVLISDSPDNTVGPGNVVSGNGTVSPGAGIWIDGPGSIFNLVIGNKVGTDITGQFAIPNSEIGVLVNQGSDNEIGGGTPGSSNLISGNTTVGVMIAGPGASGNVVGGNLVGTNVSGSAAIGNGNSTEGAGVYIDDASGNTIGGAPGFGNLISGNFFDGIQVFGPASSGNLIQGNGIGTNLAGTARLGNGADGLLINGAPRTHVIGNLLAANALDGITASGPGTTDTLIQSNFIGEGVGGQPLGNGGFGLLLINDAPSPTLVNNVNVNNTDGPVRNTSLAPASTPVASATATVSTTSKKVKVVNGQAKPSSPTSLHSKAKTSTTKATSKKK
jgi:streptogramin lyase